MKIFFVIDETRFYHPDFLAEFLRRTPDTVVGAALVTKIPPKHNIERYLFTHWYYLTMREIMLLGLHRAAMACKDKVGRKTRAGKFYSVKSVLQYFGIFYFSVVRDVNQEPYLEKIRATRPEVIVSSNSLIFKKELLTIPTRCALNRHSALLPSYGGLWPVFQAYRAGEPFTGASLHTMERGIDKGIVLSRRKVPITASDTISTLYKKCFSASVDALLEALDKVRNNDFSPAGGEFPPSYFSFPTHAHWREFRERGGKWI